MHSDKRLPEERQFKAVLIGACVLGALFLDAFVLLTCIKSTLTPRDITANWFSAWGTWAGGLATAAAFLIAAFSISVASAHARFDRREAALIRANNDMAQARLLIIHKVEDPDSISSLATYRLENRSKDLFFDVTVPFVDSPNGSPVGIERRTAALAAQDKRLHEYIPTRELLTAHRTNTEHETWFTLVTVHTRDASGIRFFVDYTDAGGRRWRQHLGGRIEPVLTSEAIPVIESDRFQPRRQIRRMTNVEAWRAGGRFTRNLPPLETDEEFLDVIGVVDVVQWTPIERVGDVTTASSDGSAPDNATTVSVTLKPTPPPFWADRFRNRLSESGLRYTGGRSGDGRQTDVFRCSPDVADTVPGLADAAITYANDQFEENELAAAKRALAARQAQQ
ncbi:hypothetical protein [Mycolicibacterium mageritense]|uniref:hypothetical protein n=1 Tax=Mycolicibacterium mageritense TaxID=53462 RepID=UPI0011DC15B7|nr:hypothetical protein [Mycolicibacterium mageritense]TXI56465.1 MAG: hypothetical protein E6Q55_28785 [Mycolicibacterium mageritense]